MFIILEVNEEKRILVFYISAVKTNFLYSIFLFLCHVENQQVISLCVYYLAAIQKILFSIAFKVYQELSILCLILLLYIGM